MAEAFRGIKITKTQVGAAGTNIPVVMPDVVEAGDYLFVFINCASYNVISSSETPPAGWTYLARDASGRFYKVADGTEGGTTVNFIATNVGTSSTKASVNFALAYRFDQPIVSMVIADSKNFQYTFPTGVTSTSQTFTQLTSTYYRAFISTLSSCDASPITPPPFSIPIDSYTLSNIDADRTGKIDHYAQEPSILSNFSTCMFERLNVPPTAITSQMSGTLYGPVTADTLGGFYRHIVLNFDAPVENEPDPEADIADGSYIPAVYERLNWY